MAFKIENQEIYREKNLSFHSICNGCHLISIEVSFFISIGTTISTYALLTDNFFFEENRKEREIENRTERLKMGWSAIWNGIVYFFVSHFHLSKRKLKGNAYWKRWFQANGWIISLAFFSEFLFIYQAFYSAIKETNYVCIQADSAKKFWYRIKGNRRVKNGNREFFRCCIDVELNNMIMMKPNCCCVCFFAIWMPQIPTLINFLYLFGFRAISEEEKTIKYIYILLPSNSKNWTSRQLDIIWHRFVNFFSWIFVLVSIHMCVWVFAFIFLHSFRSPSSANILF